MSEKRWHVVATYGGKPFDHVQEYDIEEMEELQDLIENGPDWGTLTDIRVTYNFREAAAERRGRSSPSPSA